MGIINTGRSEGVRKKTDEMAKKINEFLAANQSKYRKATSI
jgi:exopolysaccharide biosynthesis protein